MRLPSLTHLRCFESAARHQSFTAAAEEMGLTGFVAQIG
jgi:LysR family glycine cleavage system transcriptional activator